MPLQIELGHFEARHQREKEGTIFLFRPDIHKILSISVHAEPSPRRTNASGMFLHA